MRLFIATLGTETNTFASFPTGIDDFRRGVWNEGDAGSVPANPWLMPAQRWLDVDTDFGADNLLVEDDATRPSDNRPVQGGSASTSSASPH